MLAGPDDAPIPFDWNFAIATFLMFPDHDHLFTDTKWALHSAVDFARSDEWRTFFPQREHAAIEAAPQLIIERSGVPQ